MRNSSPTTTTPSLTLTQPLTPSHKPHCSMWQYMCSPVLPLFSLCVSHKLAFSNGLVISWQHNRERTVWSICSDKCLVVSALLFPAKPIMNTFHTYLHKQGRLLNHLPIKLNDRLQYNLIQYILRFSRHQRPTVQFTHSTLIALLIQIIYSQATHPFVQHTCYFVRISIHSSICCPVGQVESYDYSSAETGQL